MLSAALQAPPQRSTSATYAKLFVCRVSGLPIDAVLTLQAGSARQITTQLLELDAALAAQRQDVSDKLHAAIGAVTDKPTRNRLLALRRDLFNLRAPSPGGREAVSALPDEARAAVSAVEAGLGARTALLARLREAYNWDLMSARARLREAMRDDDFQKGLALSSRSLFRNLSRYLRHDASVLGSRNEHIERGLLRYFTRMATKATPYGRFCAVIPAELDDARDAREPLLSFSGVPAVKRSGIRLNKRIYAQLWEQLQRRPPVRGRLRVELNPTLRVENDRLVFLTALQGAEVFQRLPVNEAIDLVIEVAGASSSPTMDELIARLATDPRCESTEEEARAFLDRLVELGLLRLRSLVAEQEADWVPPLLAFLEAIDDECGQQVVQLLRQLTQLADRYGGETAERRAATIEELTAVVSAAFEAFGQRQWFPYDPPLYEDATAAATLRVNLTAERQVVLDDLAELVTITLPYAGARAEMATMRHFFGTHYGDVGNHGVPLLKFYEDFYREHFKGHLEKVRAAESGKPVQAYDIVNPFGLESIRRVRAVGDRFVAMVRELWAREPAAAEIVVTRPLLESAVAGIGQDSPPDGKSVCVFGQLMEDEDGTNIRAVIQGPHYFPGYGKYFSRFLYLLPDRWSDGVFQENTHLSRDLLAEICGDAAFNANLHPPLLPWEISYPTGQHAGSARQLRSADLHVCPDRTDDTALVLRDPTSGHRVLPVDLGFMNPRMRPPLYQLLLRFMPAGSMMFPLPATLQTPGHGKPLASPTPAAQPAVVRRPRITYRGTVVLARRSWTISAELFPVQGGDEDDSAYFCRLQQWRRDHEIPEHAYVRVRPVLAQPPKPAMEKKPSTSIPEETRVSETESPDAQLHDAPPEPGTKLQEGKQPLTKVPDRASRDWHKPQFIDFGNPILVRLFARIASGLKRFSVVIEECLPGVKQLPTSGNNAYVVELILQLGFPDQRQAWHDVAH